MNTLLQDVRYGLRMLVKNPSFTAVAVLTLAIGIGANTTIFTVVNAVLLNPLPVADSQQLVSVNTTDARNGFRGQPIPGTSLKNFKDMRDQSHSFSGMVVFTFAGLAISGKGEPQQVPGLLVGGNYFDVLGVKPALGRFFLPDEAADDTGKPVCVLSHAVWTKQYGGDRGIVGQTITLNAQPYTVIGVAPQHFKGTFSLANPELIWLPIGVRKQVLTGFTASFIDNRRAMFVGAFARLKPGVTLQQGESELQGIAARLEQAFPLDNKGRGIQLQYLNDEALGAGQRTQFMRAGGLMMTVVGVVLLIACVNLANLLLARSSARSREISIRAALGATRIRLVRQLLTESLLLSLLGALAGLAVAYWGRNLLWSFRPPFLRQDAVQLTWDVRVFAFTAVLAVLTGMLFGLFPAFRASNAEVNNVLRSGTRSLSPGSAATRLRGALVVAEVALALVALVGAGLFLRNLQQAQRLDPGFESHNLVLMFFDLGSQHYSPDRGQLFYREAVERAAATPGVVAAAVASNAPLGGGFARTIFLESQQQAAGQVGSLTTVNSISPSFFDTMRIPLINGRVFTDQDGDKSTLVAIANRAMVKKLWPGQDPIGKRFSFFGEPQTLRQIVGVVADTAVTSVGEDPVPVVYLPMQQNYSPAGLLYARTSGDPTAAVAPIRNQLQQMDHNLPVQNPATIAETFRNDQGLWAARVGAGLLSLFGALAMALAAVGIYGVLSYTVSQRTAEIGVRMALGAGPRQILRLIVGEGMALALVGAGVGLVFALVAGRLVRGLMFNVSAADPLALGGAAVVLISIALLACWIPARRAVKIDPNRALRQE